MTAPDQWGTDLDPPYCRRIRHGRMGLPAVIAVSVIVFGAVGGLGWLVYSVCDAVSSAMN